MNAEDKKHALKTARKLGWEGEVPLSTLIAISNGGKIKFKRTNDKIKDFGKDRYGKSSHLSKRHYLEREREKDEL